MRNFQSLFACLAIATSLVPARAGDLPKLEGAWQLVETEANGKKDTGRSKNYRWEFKDNQYRIYQNDVRAETWTVKLDGRSIDSTLTISPKIHGITLKGIYELSGDTLRICYDRTGKKPRPDDFSAPAGSQRVIYSLRRR